MIGISELREYHLNRDPARHEPFRVTLHLKTPVVLYDPLRLDALLSYAVVSSLNLRLPQSAEPYFLPVPLRCEWTHPKLKLPLWACTDLEPCEPNTIVSAFWHKRTIRPELLKRSRSGKPVNIRGTQGAEKEYRIPLPQHTSHKWRCEGVGDIEEVCRLLKGVGSVGKKRSQGYGIVQRWEIEPIEGFAFREGDGRVKRPLPGAFIMERQGVVGITATSLSGWTPPYWLQSTWVLCEVPKSTAKNL
jgi:hypothetical protein